MKNPYAKGANFERKLMKYHNELGFDTFRMAGSHSFADLIMFYEDFTYFVQCKNREFNNTDFNESIDKMRPFIEKYKLRSSHPFFKFWIVFKGRNKDKTGKFFEVYEVDSDKIYA